MEGRHQEDGYRGLDVRLPAVQRFVADLAGKQSLNPVTEYLADKLYHRAEPRKLPQALATQLRGGAAKADPQRYEDPHTATTSGTHNFSFSYAYGTTGLHPAATVRGPPQDPGFYFSASSDLLHRIPNALPASFAQPGKALNVPRAVPGRPSGTYGEAAGEFHPQQQQQQRHHNETTFFKDCVVADGGGGGGGGVGTGNAGSSGGGGAAAAAAASEASGKFVTVVRTLLDKAKGAGRPAPSRWSKAAREAAQAAAEEAIKFVQTIHLPVKHKQFSKAASEVSARLSHTDDLAGRSDMLQILDQLAHFNGFDEDLKRAIADHFVVYKYPPDSYLYNRGETCNEIHVLLSGQVLVRQPGHNRQPQRLLPGTFLGLDVMLQRARLPRDVDTDPNFECVIATLSWQQYQQTIYRWAAQRVCALVPDLPHSLASTLRAGIAGGCSYEQRASGEALFLSGALADCVMLMIKGQVLVTQPASEDQVQTESGYTTMLHAALGETDLVLPSDAPTIQPRSSFKSTMRSSNFEGLSPMRPLPLSSLALDGRPGSSGKVAAATAPAAGSGGDSRRSYDSPESFSLGGGGGGGGGLRPPRHALIGEDTGRASGGPLAGDDSAQERDHPPPPLRRRAGFGSGDNLAEEASGGSSDRKAAPRAAGFAADGVAPSAEGSQLSTERRRRAGFAIAAVNTPTEDVEVQTSNEGRRRAGFAGAVEEGRPASTERRRAGFAGGNVDIEAGSAAAGTSDKPRPRAGFAGVVGADERPVSTERRRAGFAAGAADDDGDRPTSTGRRRAGFAGPSDDVERPASTEKRRAGFADASDASEERPASTGRRRAGFAGAAPEGDERPGSGGERRARTGFATAGETSADGDGVRQRRAAGFADAGPENDRPMSSERRRAGFAEASSSGECSRPRAGFASSTADNEERPASTGRRRAGFADASEAADVQRADRGRGEEDTKAGPASARSARRAGFADDQTSSTETDRSVAGSTADSERPTSGRRRAGVAAGAADELPAAVEGLTSRRGSPERDEGDKLPSSAAAGTAGASPLPFHRRPGSADKGGSAAFDASGDAPAAVQEDDEAAAAAGGAVLHERSRPQSGAERCPSPGADSAGAEASLKAAAVSPPIPKVPESPNRAFVETMTLSRRAPELLGLGFVPEDEEPEGQDLDGEESSEFEAEVRALMEEQEDLVAADAWGVLPDDMRLELAKDEVRERRAAAAAAAAAVAEAAAAEAAASAEADVAGDADTSASAAVDAAPSEPLLQQASKLNDEILPSPSSLMRGGASVAQFDFSEGVPFARSMRQEESLAGVFDSSPFPDFVHAPDALQQVAAMHREPSSPRAPPPLRPQPSSNTEAPKAAEAPSHQAAPRAGKKKGLASSTKAAAAAAAAGASAFAPMAGSTEFVVGALKPWTPRAASEDGNGLVGDAMDAVMMAMDMAEESSDAEEEDDVEDEVQTAAAAAVADAALQGAAAGATAAVAGVPVSGQASSKESAVAKAVGKANASKAAASKKGKVGKAAKKGAITQSDATTGGGGDGTVVVGGSAAPMEGSGLDFSKPAPPSIKSKLDSGGRQKAPLLAMAQPGGVGVSSETPMSSRGSSVGTAGWMAAADTAAAASASGSAKSKKARGAAATLGAAVREAKVGPSSNGAMVEGPGGSKRVGGGGSSEGAVGSLAAGWGFGGSPKRNPSASLLRPRGVGCRSSADGGGGGAAAAGGERRGPVGTPMWSAVAAALKKHRQHVCGGVATPAFFGDEALQAGSKPTRERTAVAIRPTEVVLIPRALFFSLLPPTHFAKATGLVLAQQNEALMSHGTDTLPAAERTWPHAAPLLRDYLHSGSPGSRPMWQVEELAAAFSALPIFARMPWQTRLQVFQHLELRTIPRRGQIQLARTDISVDRGEDSKNQQDDDGDEDQEEEDEEDHGDGSTSGGGGGRSARASNDWPAGAYSSKSASQRPSSGGNASSSSPRDRQRSPYDDANSGSLGGSGDQDSFADSPALSQRLSDVSSQIDQVVVEGGAADGKSATAEGQQAAAPARPASAANSNAAGPPIAGPIIVDAHTTKLDDSIYILVSGRMALESHFVPDSDDEEDDEEDDAKSYGSRSPRAPPLGRGGLGGGLRRQSSGSDADADDGGDTRSGGGASHGAHPVTVLKNVGHGESFTASMIMELSEAPHRDGASPEPQASLSGSSRLQQQQQQLPQQDGAIHLSATASRGEAEVLSMPRPLFDLVTKSAGGRMMLERDIPLLLARCGWAAHLAPGTLAKALHGHVRVDDYKKGTELLRLGEPAPVVYILQSGELSIRATPVGLEPQHAASAQLGDLTMVKEGESCGELSLEGDRPLWYGLMTRSATARVASIEVAALRTLLAGMDVADARLALLAAAQADMALYSAAVYRQALQVQEGQLRLTFFSAAMRRLVQHVLALGPFDSAAFRNNGQVSAPATAGNNLAATRRVIVEEGSKADDFVELLSRPRVLGVTVNEAASALAWKRTMDSHTQDMTALLLSSHITLDPSLPVGGAPSAVGGDRIALLAPSIDGDLRGPTAVRPPKAREQRAVPAELTPQGVDARNALVAAASRTAVLTSGDAQLGAPMPQVSLRLKEGALSALLAAAQEQHALQLQQRREAALLQEQQQLLLKQQRQYLRGSSAPATPTDAATNGDAQQMAATNNNNLSATAHWPASNATTVACHAVLKARPQTPPAVTPLALTSAPMAWMATAPGPGSPTHLLTPMAPPAAAAAAAVGGSAPPAPPVAGGGRIARSTWVRDRMHDPSGLAGPLISDLVSTNLMRRVPDSLAHLALPRTAAAAAADAASTAASATEAAAGLPKGSAPGVSDPLGARHTLHYVPPAPARLPIASTSAPATPADGAGRHAAAGASVTAATAAAAQPAAGPRFRPIPPHLAAAAAVAADLERRAGPLDELLHEDVMFLTMKPTAKPPADLGWNTAALARKDAIAAATWGAEQQSEVQAAQIELEQQQRGPQTWRTMLGGGSGSGAAAAAPAAVPTAGGAGGVEREGVAAKRGTAPAPRVSLRDRVGQEGKPGRSAKPGGKRQSAAASWVVPQFNSANGFEAGYFDETSGIIYFD